MTPINYKLYPANWKEIRAHILERAENKCEQCGVLNHDYVFRGKLDGEDCYQTASGSVYCANTGRLLVNSEFLPASMYPNIKDVGKRDKATRVVLTIAHKNHDIADNRDENLAAWCQRCHLLWDHSHHVANAKKTRQKKSGLQSLFP